MNEGEDEIRNGIVGSSSAARFVHRKRAEEEEPTMGLKKKTRAATH
jgi:hypothetical protein